MMKFLVISFLMMLQKKILLKNVYVQLVTKVCGIEVKIPSTTGPIIKSQYDT